ncbi:hypothetical protein AD24_4966 [Escherichia coli 2-011-08_S4_C3]|nr:hypothetical protein AC66_4779 [Escherichia coli 2-011-08_S4_C1]KDT09205.1 hypothetical protein AD24_4966 [Escherichia coli 2-011-08_S4_C3]
MRFDDNIILELIKTEWWNILPADLLKLPKDDIGNVISALNEIDKTKSKFPVNYIRIDGNSI